MGQSQPVTLQCYDFDVGRRVVLLLGTEDNVIADFHHTVDVLEKLVHFGPQDRWWQRLQPGQKEAVGIVIDRFSLPVSELISRLSSDVYFAQHRVECLSPSSAPGIVTMPNLLERDV
jgi:hypothetical protein